MDLEKYRIFGLLDTGSLTAAFITFSFFLLPLQVGWVMKSALTFYI
jgi:hypothetical protein